MELFRRRYLCLIAAIFVFTSLFVLELGSSLQFALIAWFLVAVTVAAILFIFQKKRRFLFLVILLSVGALLFAALHSFLFIGIPRARAESYTGELYAEMKILSREYIDDNSAEYIVRILDAEGDSPNIKAHLVCDFPAEFSAGDRIIASVEAEAIDSIGGVADGNVLLMLKLDERQTVLYAKAEESFFFSFDGIKGLTSDMRDGFAEYVDSIFGDDSALVRGMLVNDKSELSTHTKAQFRRAGAAHVLAVSGLHVSLLLGALELLLRKLLAPKRLRIALLGISGIILLALTNFSPSSVRSVLMLFAVYANYLFAEESDAPTSLFVAVALIILFSPFSVTDVGMWMSFCATLGLVTVFPILEKKIPRFNVKNKILALICRILTAALQVMLITVVANIFTLPIMFYCFGQISLSAILCNLFLTPLTAVFLPLCVVALIFGRVAFIGEALVMLAKGISSLIVGTVGFFADMRGAVLSLEYPFVPPLVVLLAISMTLLMLIKLKKKLFIALPPIAFVLSFTICFAVFAVTDREKIKYVGWGENELFFVERAGVSSVCDVSTGASSVYNLLADGLCDYSVEIENYVLTHPHANHSAMLRRLCENRVVRRLYLPLMTDDESLGILADIRNAISEYNTEIIFYKCGEEIKLSEKTKLLPFFLQREGKNEVFLKICGKDDVITYTDEAENDLAFALGAKSRYFLVGAHGEPSENDEMAKSFNGDVRLIFANESVAKDSRIEKNGTVAYIIGKGGGKRELLITH